MNATITLDKAGRVSIPKALREELHLGPGDSLQLDSHGDQIILRPVRTPVPLRKEDGVWVLRTGTRLSASATGKLLEDLRSERDALNIGLNR